MALLTSSATSRAFGPSESRAPRPFPDGPSPQGRPGVPGLPPLGGQYADQLHLVNQRCRVTDSSLSRQEKRATLVDWLHRCLMRVLSPPLNRSSRSIDEHFSATLFIIGAVARAARDPVLALEVRGGSHRQPVRHRGEDTRRLTGSPRDRTHATITKKARVPRGLPDGTRDRCGVLGPPRRLRAAAPHGLRDGHLRGGDPNTTSGASPSTRPSGLRNPVAAPPSKTKPSATASIASA